MSSMGYWPTFNRDDTLALVSAPASGRRVPRSVIAGEGRAGVERLAGVSIDFRRLDGALVIGFRGEVDLHSAEPVRAALHDVIRDQGNLTLTIDLGEMTFIDSTGLNVLAQASKWSQESGGTIVLTRPQPHIVRVFELVGFPEVFEFTA